MYGLPVLPENLVREYPGLGEYSVLVMYRGSVTHGTWRPSSDPTSVDDVDVMAVAVPPAEYYFGLKQFGSRGTQEVKRDEWDVVVYELRKFMGMLVQGNPNVVTSLWLLPEHYLKVTPAGQLLLDNRKLFVGRHVYFPFVGYATSQLKGMEKMEFHGHMGERRKKLVMKNGYDTKHAAHLLRLLRMGVEFLKTGEFQVYRPDADELVAVKRGERTLESVKAEAEELFKQAEEAYLVSKLPDRPDMGAVNRLAVEVVSTTLLQREVGVLV